MSSETSLASSSTTGPSGTISQTISPDGIYPGPGGRYLYGSDTNGPTPTYSSSEGYYYEGNGPSSIYGFYAGEMGAPSGLATKELSATSTTAPTPQCRRWVGREGALRGPLKGVWD